MEIPKKVVVTGVLVKNDDGKLLLVKKQDGVGPYPGTYLTPGGGVEPGERIDDAALRELYEETGVRVKNLKRAFFDDFITENWEGEVKHFVALLYTADYVSGDLKPTENDDDNLEIIKWFSLEELKTLPFSPPLHVLLNHLGYATK